MRITIRPKKICTVLIASYLINSFYFVQGVALQKVFVWGCVFLYLLLNINSIISLVKKYLFKLPYKQLPFLMILLWGILILLTPVFHGTGDFSYFSVFISMIASVASFFVILVRIGKSGKCSTTLEEFMRVYIFAMALYVCSTVFALLVPSYRNFIINNIDMTPHAKRMIEMELNYTRIGFAGLSVFNSGMKCAVANAFSLFFIYKDIKNMNKVKGRHVILFLVTLLGEFFYARTAVLATIACIIVFIWFLIYKIQALNQFIKYVMLGLLAMALLVVFVNNYTGDNESIKWTFELFKSLMNGKGLSSTTLTIMNRMNFTPSFSTMLLGDGYYVNAYGGYYMNTDLGYLRAILYYGVPGLVFASCVVLSMSRSIAKVGSSSEFSLIRWFFLIIYVIFEIKGEALGVLIPILFIVYFATTSSPYDNYSE